MIRISRSFKSSLNSNIRQYTTVLIFVTVSTIICYTIRDIIGYQVVSFLLLFLVSILAIFFGTGPILLAATLCALTWNFFFIPPQFTLHIDKPLDVLMLVMFFIIALLNGVLTSRLRIQEKKTRKREERTNALYQLTKDLSNISGYDELTKVVVSNVSKFFHINSAIILKNEHNQLNEWVQNNSLFNLNDNELSFAIRSFQHSFKVGKYTDIDSLTEYTYYPLLGNNVSMGVIIVKHKNNFTLEEEQFWEAFISQISGKFEREFLRDATKRTYLLSESEKLYKTLFNSISHELRIPVTTILGASDTLLTQSYPDDIRKKLYSEINIASVRLNRLIENLLNMSRLESGRITSHPDWCDVHDLANSVSESLHQELQPFKLSVIIPPDMPLVQIDFGLTEQILHNLILNATQYAPVGTRIRVKFFYDNGFLTIQVMDRGEGFPASDLLYLFEKFYRGKDTIAGGTGLGLSIVKGFVEAQRGKVVAENRQNGGAILTIMLPTKILDINDYKKSEE
ncbi:MAG: DUF4118 domain-containing protein [Tenuifilaceae bacterium]